MKMLVIAEGEGSDRFAISLGRCLADRADRWSLLRALMPALAPTGTGSCDAASIGYQPSGQPFLRTSGRPSLHLSFSHSGTELWAALCRDRPIGIDAARPIEFRSPYPRHRVFHLDEWARAAAICPHSRDIAPLLWVLKEAAVKALGCGFGALEPLAVRNRALWNERGAVRSRIDAGNELHGTAFRPEPDLWVGIAWMTKEVTT